MKVREEEGGEKSKASALLHTAYHGCKLCQIVLCQVLAITLVAPCHVQHPVTLVAPCHV